MRENISNRYMSYLIENGPSTTIELAEVIYPYTNVWDRRNSIAKTYRDLKNLEKQGFIQKGAIVGHNRTWVVA